MQGGKRKSQAEVNLMSIGQKGGEQMLQTPVLGGCDRELKPMSSSNMGFYDRNKQRQTPNITGSQFYFHKSGDQSDMLYGTKTEQQTSALLNAASLIGTSQEVEEYKKLVAMREQRLASGRKGIAKAPSDSHPHFKIDTQEGQDAKDSCCS